MANKHRYKPDEELPRALKVIEEEGLVLFGDVRDYLGYGSDETFYRLFPKDSDAHDQISEALRMNKIKEKLKLRNKLKRSKSPAGLIAMYKLLADSDELKRLNNIKDDGGTLTDYIEKMKNAFQPIRKTETDN